jgi:A/G-specific adenine glycosylase
MLQQTQVERVVEKYPLFIRRFPTVIALSRARLATVLRVWQGMGYNRRAVYLRLAAREILRLYGGAVPSGQEELDNLPGIGAATASSIRAFAFNKPSVFIETNIRSVFIHHFFSGKENISDASLLPLLQRTLDTENPRRWYSALMDYGAYLKKQYANPSRKSAHHKPQRAFQGSTRQVRGHIIKLLVEKRKVKKETVYSFSFCDRVTVDRLLQGLQKEGLIRIKKDTLSV